MDVTTRRGSHLATADRRFALGGGWLSRVLAGSFARVLDRVDAGLTEGGLDATLPSGAVRRLGGRAPGPQAAIFLTNWMPVVRLATGGSAGFARAYLDGDWTSPDPVAIYELFMRNRVPLGEAARGNAVVRGLNRAMRWLQKNSRSGARRNISFHYDLGNDFYAAWLDETMSYSSAIWADGDDLAGAQRRKVRTLLDRLAIKPGDTLLEIGCGWGGLAEIAARDYGARVHGITLSSAQLSYARERMARAGLEDRVTLELCDYRDVSGRYDHVASVEMFEAVGRRYWPDFMQAVHAALEPGGKAVIQTIVLDEAVWPAYAHGADFIQAYIFPGGILPSEPRFRAAAEQAGLRWGGRAAYGPQYARTLCEWRGRYDAARAEGRLPPGFDDRFDRIWRSYLMYCEGGFRSGGIDVVQAELIRAA